MTITSTWSTIADSDPGLIVRPEVARKQIDAEEELDATHMSVNTMGAGFETVDQHIDALRRFKEVAGG